MNTFKHLGPALVELRMLRRRSQRDVAEDAGITKAMLSSYENERTSPNVGTLGKILDALEVGPAELERALRSVQKGPHDASRLGSFEFGHEERELVAGALEQLGRVFENVLIPWLRSSGARPSPDGESDD